MQRIKSAIKRIMASTAGWPLTALLLREQGVTVLMYHRVTTRESLLDGMNVDVFRTQMRWLKRRCNLIRPEELMARASEGRRLRPSVLITFDDGCRDYYDNAYPILRELRIPALLFLATAFMDHGGLIWTEELQLAVLRSAARQIRLPWAAEATWDLTSEPMRRLCLEKAKQHLKGIPDARRRRDLRQLRQALGTPAPALADTRQMMQWDEVRATLDLTTLGGHSHTHPILSQLDAGDMEREIVTCRQRISEETGVTPRYFAYPNGRNQDFNAITRKLLQRHGFLLAFSTITGINGRKMDPMALRRQPPGITPGELSCMVAGLWRE